MSKTEDRDHRETILDQFSRQAVPFAELPGHMDEMQMLLELASVSNTSTVLDVACGPGLVACEFAMKAKHVTGIDITPAMIQKAKQLQKEKQLSNVIWDIGDVLPLSYGDNCFSIVMTRYSFHHFMDPEAVLTEMIRVCMPGGKVLVADPVLPDEKVDAYNRVEKLRDPSHTSALTFGHFEKMLNVSGLVDLQRGSYSVEMELEKQLKASFPNPGDNEKIREIFRNDVGADKLGLGIHYVGEEIHFAYPISVYAGRKICWSKAVSESGLSRQNHAIGVTKTEGPARP